MHRSILVFVFISFQIQINAGKNADSLLNVIKTTGNNAHKIDMLNLLASEVLDENYDLASSYSEEALRLAKKINYKSGAFDASYLLGKIHVNYTLNFSKAISYFTYALNLCDKNHPEQKLQVFSQLAFINKRQENFDKAIHYYKESFQIAQEKNNLKEMSNLSAYLAEIYEETGDRNRVLFYLKKVLDIEKQTEFKNTSPAALISIAHYYELCHQWGPAESYLSDALNKFKCDKNYRWESYTDGLLSKLYLQKKNYLQAKVYANEGLNIALKYRLSKEIADNHNFLVAVYDSLKDYKNAYTHIKALKNINDSVFDIEKTKEIANIQSHYESSVKQEDLLKATLEKEISDSKLKKIQMVLIAAIVVVILLIVLTIILSRNYRVKKAVNLELENRDELRKLKLDEIIKKLNSEIIEHRQTKAKLEIMNAELNNFMYSSSHDLKGPLAAIKGLTNLAATEVNEKERLEYITMISTSVSKLNTLIDDMVQTTKVTHGNIEWSTINFVDFVNGIIDDIKNIESSKGVKFILEADINIELTTDKILFRTIMYNLIENATKYKTISKEESFVKVSARKEQKDLKISVIDNGIGIDEKNKEKVFDMFSRANQTIPGTGLGLYLVKKSVIKLGGNINLESTEGKGSTFEVTLPDLVADHLKQQLFTS
jgi:signal transduction histidine kinase